jgi:polyisoprenoid-binding protein YceI
MKTLFLLPAALIAAALPFPRQPTTALPLGEHDWVVDASNSSVVFRVKHANAAFFMGTFDKIEGKLTLDPANVGDGSVSLTIPVESVDTNNERRDGHLKSPDFFKAKENPTIAFTSTGIERDGAKLRVAGELSMAGVKKAITMAVEKVGEGEFHGPRVGYTTTFTVKRSDFGMTYGLDGNVLGDEVTLMIGLELTKS